MMEVIERWVAWHLPKRVVYWCVVREQSLSFQSTVVPLGNVYAFSSNEELSAVLSSGSVAAD
jgi:hypothetical protein